MVKVLLQLYPVLPAESEEERVALRPLGRNRERYQEVLRGWNEIVQAADELGVWGVASPEHHFHSEGYEVSPSPGVLATYWGAITKKVRVGALGYTMTTQDPFRVAEDIAIIDHLTQGRTFAGFSRGYQSRWTNVLGQHIGGIAAMSDGSEADQDNRRVFEEQLDIVIKAWTEDSFKHESDLWKIPNTPGSGPEAWPMADWTAKMGAPGEMSDDGHLEEISVVPAPYTDPHPPVFVASNSSVETVRWAGERGFVPVYFANIGTASRHGPSYVEGAASVGRKLALGQNQGIVRWPRIADTRAQALDDLAEHDGDIFKHFYEPFLGAVKADHVRMVAADAPRSASVDPMLKSGLFIPGTVSEVRDEYVKQWKEMPAEYAVLIYHYAQQPKESVIENLRLFMSEIVPALDETIDYEETNN